MHSTQLTGQRCSIKSKKSSRPGFGSIPCVTVLIEVVSYVDGAPVMVICGGEDIEIIHSRFGTQQGDVVATHYFGFATMNFAAELVPEAQISWIVDHLIDCSWKRGGNG